MWKMSTRDALKANWISINCKLLLLTDVLLCLLRAASGTGPCLQFLFPASLKKKTKTQKTRQPCWSEITYKFNWSSCPSIIFLSFQDVLFKHEVTYCMFKHSQIHKFIFSWNKWPCDHVFLLWVRAAGRKMIIRIVKRIVVESKLYLFYCWE